jgi:G:T-mismatch repair DNA endonuclease (very short patch repair protein)
MFGDGCRPKPKRAPFPKNRAEWRAAKFSGNRARDLLVTRTLRKTFWRVVWGVRMRSGAEESAARRPSHRSGVAIPRRAEAPACARLSNIPTGALANSTAERFQCYT